jgi:hypothetical protein
MFDFDKRLSESTETNPRDLIALFESLDRRATHTVLRPVQSEALTSLAERLEARDTVLKLSTGAGKTTVGLVYLFGQLKLSKRPVVYLCPTVQLVGQVLAEAQNLGIPAVEYPQGQPHPGVEALSGRAVIVCTYDKLFNAKTTFDRTEVFITPHAILLDDAHAGVEEVRDSFTLRFPPTGSAYSRLLDVLRPYCKNYSSSWRYIERGDPTAALEVPYWVWTEVLENVRAAIETEVSEKPNVFVWEFLREHLRWCRCVVSATGIEVVPDVPLVDSVRAYRDASHRLFMTATLADDSVLVREMACSPADAAAPIIPPSDAGVGERMVLAPSLIDPSLDREWVMRWCQHLTRHHLNVVVLTPSEKAARDWEAVGAVVELGANVTDTVQALRSGRLSFVAFAQRYDGVDLPDAACRVLVIDGMPKGQGIADSFDSRDPNRPGGALNRWVHRVEQGMGRAVRSHVDFAVIVLSGPEIAHFVARPEVREAMSAGTRAQLDLSHELTDMAKEKSATMSPGDAAHAMAMQCIRRDDGWKRFYDQKVRRATKGQNDADPNALALADAERRAFMLALARNAVEAARVIGKAVDNHITNDRRKGWYLQRQAAFTHAFDPDTALRLQRAAYDKNSSVCTPPEGAQVRPLPTQDQVPAAILSDWLSDYTTANGAIAAFTDLRPKLDFSTNPDQFEEGLKLVAALFGAEGFRPEKQYGREPDNLWRWPDQDWVMEAKNKRGVLSKGDGEQLLAAMEWHKTAYPEREAVPVVIAALVQPEFDAVFPSGTRVLTPEHLKRLLGNLEKLLIHLGAEGPLFRNAKMINEALLNHGLDPRGFGNRYSVPLAKPRTRR